MFHFMKNADLPELLLLACEAARAAGGLIKANFGLHLKVDALENHDIKLELDRRSQTLIESILLSRHPDYAIYGEEGISGPENAQNQWIIDPIDGTVNFFYGIPHFCISIALRRAGEIVLGVIYDPLRDELWSGVRGGTPTLNGHPIQVSSRTELSEAIVTIGFSKSAAAIDAGIPILARLAHSVKKCRMMGSAALDVAYVACGRLDAYIESKISLWDIAAGALLVELGGGQVELTPLPDDPDKFRAVIHSGKLDYGLK
jgi:myo-inositol-1(or 4)-monophosphatase